MNLGEIPAKHARLTPGREAVIDIPTGRRVTWRALEARVGRAANAFRGGSGRGLGLQSGDRVAILSKNCIEFLETFFACARAGLIAQPLNWRLGTGELGRILDDGTPSVVLASQEFAGLARELEAPGRRWLDFGEPGSEYEKVLAAASEDDAKFEVTGHDPVLILYTGGTTGESKGALHSHHGLWTGMLNQTVAERIVPSDVYMLTGQMFHIPVALAVNYMAHGCPLVLVNFEARQALEVIQRERVSAFLGITTMLNWMMAVDGFESYDLSSLRNIQYGGGPMPESVVRAALQAFPCTLIQGYGQTEGMTMSFLSQEDHQRAVDGVHPERLRSCGREGFVTRLRVVDERGVEVPKDGATPGEIVIASEANMLGYWQRPDLTAETLRDGWMHTGDIATWDADSYVYIVDRAKDMIISGGENIYSTQVENAIHQHPAVLESAVIGVPDTEWGEVVKAVVVLKPNATASAQDIIDTAKQHLASYQKPRIVEFVDALPKAPTGKILKRALRDAHQAGQEDK
ncbi:MAG: AMP-binding protein [bacterium]